MIKEISGDNIDLTESLKVFVENHLNKIKHFNNEITRTEVILKMDKNIFIAEINASVPHENKIHAESKGSDMYLAIEAATNKIVSQLRKIKVKNESKRKIDKHLEILELNNNL